MEKAKEQKEKRETNSSYFVILKSQYEWLRKQSYIRHMSMSAIVREAIDLLIKQTKPEDETKIDEKVWE